VSRRGDREIGVELIASRPNDETLDRLPAHNLAFIDSVLPSLLDSDDSVKRFAASDSPCEPKRSAGPTR